MSGPSGAVGGKGALDGLIRGNCTGEQQLLQL